MYAIVDVNSKQTDYAREKKETTETRQLLKLLILMQEVCHLKAAQAIEIINFNCFNCAKTKYSSRAAAGKGRVDGLLLVSFGRYK